MSTDSSLLPSDLQDSLDEFHRRALPVLLRRYRSWQGLSPLQRADLHDDFIQELWLDCLQAREELLRLSPAERRSRWYRLLEHHHYHLYTKSVRRSEATAEDAPELSGRLDSTLDTDTRWLLETSGLDREQRQLTVQLLRDAAFCNNGRLNCRQTSQRLGYKPQIFTQHWDRLADRLGFGSEFLDFWRRRLIEALLGLAADLLRDQADLRLWAEHRRRRPDPRGRLQRIHRIRRHLQCRPLTKDLRHILPRYRHKLTSAPLRPEEVLADARSLAPADPRIELWSFEAAAAQGHPTAAARSLRRARRCGADSGAIDLARARLLQLRGREASARWLLQRSSQRHPGDPRLVAACASLPPDDSQSASTTAISSARAASNTGSPVTGLQPAPPTDSRRR